MEWTEARFRRRKLPHLDVDGRPFFITACLKGSISASGLRQMREYRDELDRRPKPPGVKVREWELRLHKLMFRFVDSLLDGSAPVNHLSDSRLAKIVQNAFLHFAGERYHLFAFVVMPSHHHWVFQPTEKYVEELAQSNVRKRRTPREAISHSIQSYTATMCNRLLDRNGVFWQKETFDHFVRCDDELMRIIEYVEDNPVVARLARSPCNYKWSSAPLRMRFGIPIGEPIVLA